MMKKFATIVAAALVLCGAAPSVAAAQTLNFVPPSGDLLGSHVFTFGPYGFVVASTNENGVHVYGKNEGAGNTETGLGLCIVSGSSCTSLSDYEIFNPHSLFLDLTGLTAGDHRVITLGSVQEGEMYSVSGSADGVTYSVIASGTGPTTANDMALVDVSGSRYLRFDVPAGGSGANNYLVNSITATPEPASLVLLGTGLVGVFGAVRRRRNS